MEPDGRYDAVLCCHLVWTLTDPAAVFGDWFPILRPGGRLLIYDGDWAKPNPSGRWAAQILHLWEKQSPDLSYDAAMGSLQGDIMRRLPFGEGLTFQQLNLMLETAGFSVARQILHEPIARAQRRTSGLRNNLRTRVYSRFILSAQKPVL